MTARLTVRTALVVLRVAGDWVVGGAAMAGDGRRDEGRVGRWVGVIVGICV